MYTPLGNLIDLLVRLACGERVEKANPRQWRVLWASGVVLALAMFLLGFADDFFSSASPSRLFFTVLGIGVAGVLLLFILTDHLRTGIIATLGIAGWIIAFVQAFIVFGWK